ncbi:MAK10-like protein [Tanacetum coccineum]
MLIPRTSVRYPNQHLKNFLKLMDSLDLDGENRERTRLRLFQFSLRDQASNWLECLPAGSITTWEDLNTRFLAQFFPPRRTAKLRNDILIRTIDQSADGKLRDLNAKESWALLEDLSLYDNESWNDPRDFAKPIKAITLPQDVPSISDRRLIELENQIYSGPHDTRYCMEDPEQAFVEYASLRTDEAGDFMIIEDISSIIDPRLSQVVLGRPFVEIFNMTHDPQEGVVRFTNGNDEVAYKMPHKIEQYNSLSNLEKEHTKSVYLRNEEDKRRGVEYVMSKILGFYKECLELGPEYLTGMDDEGEVTYLAFGRHLDEIHVTWAHLEKKRQDYEPTPTSLKNFYSKAGDGVTDYT